MRTITDRVCDIETLTNAFRQVRNAIVRTGSDDLAEAELALGDWLTVLAADLRSGSWEPGSMRRVEVPKADGGTRVLQIPGAVDRIVERAVTDALIGVVDHRLSPNSFAFRSGYGVAAATRQLVGWRDEGIPWVVRSDVADCFASLDHQRVLDTTRRFTADAWLIRLVERLLDRPERWRGRFTYHDEGLPQGAPLSPLLCNLYLDDFDRFLAHQGVPVIRYADDFTLACNDEHEALEVRQLALEAANRIGLDLAFDKTTVASFERGFVFLGQEIGPSHPTNEPDLAYDDGKRLRRSLYITVPGAAATLRDGQVVIRDDDQDIFNAPLTMIDRLVTVGPVGVSAGLRNQLLTTDIDTSFISPRGTWLGRLDNGRHHSPELLRAQLRASDNPPRRLELARSFVLGKLSNLDALLTRSLRRDNVVDLDAELDRIESAIDSAHQAADISQLLGAEGAGSQAYFQALRALLPPHAGFTGRNRRPPLDPANAALSYGYAIVLGEAVSAMRRVGLDPAIGLLHTDDRSRPSGALDLIEELRPMIVDTVVIELFRRGVLKPTLFTTDSRSGAVMLGDDGRRKLSAAIEERLLTSVTHVPTRTKGSYRRLIVLQARQLAECVREPDADYDPQPWR